MAIAVTRAVDMTDSENVWSSISAPFEKAENTDTLFSNEVDASDLEWDDGLAVDAFICDIYNKIFLQHSSRVLEFQCMLRLLLKLTVICLHGLLAWPFVSSFSYSCRFTNCLSLLRFSSRTIWSFQVLFIGRRIGWLDILQLVCI